MSASSFDMSTFRITYDGPALRSSEMDVRELAPALLAIGELLEAATLSAYSGKLKPQVNVRGSFKTGSFGIDFVLATDWVAQVRDFLSGPDVGAAVNALTILGTLGWLGRKSRVKLGLFAVLKWVRGRAITRVENTDRGVAILHVEGERLEVEQVVLTLLRDVAVRQAVEKVLAPLARPGITSFHVGPEEDPLALEVISAERAAFDMPVLEEELLVDESRKMVFSIVSLAFKDDNKWRLHDGSTTIHAAIEDAPFLARVDSNLENFAKGDILICRVRVRQWQTLQGAKTDYVVQEVVEHRTPGRQLSLPGI